MRSLGSLFFLVRMILTKAPDYLDLLTAGTDSEFNDALDKVLERAVAQLEGKSRDFQGLGEKGLSGALAMALTVPGLLVTNETDSNGHVDLTITATGCFPVRTVLGEAKIYDGPAYHFKGLEQLVERYLTGREGRGLLIIYFRRPDLVGYIKRLRQEMDHHKPCEQLGLTEDHRVLFWFYSTHQHRTGRPIMVTHIGCNLV